MKVNNSFRTICAVSSMLASGFLHAATVDLVTNGGFETGDFSGWSQTINGSQSISVTNPSSGSFSAFLSNGSPSANIIQQTPLGAGLLSPGQSVDFSIDYRGSALAGGVLFIELFSLDAGNGVSKSELQGPLFPDADPDVWQTFTHTFILGPDVTNGITLLLNAACGAATGCVSDYYVDNISLTAEVVPVPAAVWLFGSGLLGLIGVARRRV